MDINYTWSCREVYDHYMTVSIRGLQQGYFSTRDDMGIETDITVSDVGIGYVTFKIHNNNTPAQGVTRFVYEWGGTEVINANIEWDNTQATYDDDIGAFAVYNPQEALFEAKGGRYMMQYYSYNVNVPETFINANYTWVSIVKEGNIIYVDASKNTTSGTRVSKLTISPKCLFLDDYLEDVELTVYQDAGEYKPADASEFSISPSVFYCSPAAQSATCVTEQVNIESVTVNTNVNWLHPTYSTSTQEITIGIDINTGAARSGAVSVTAIGTDKTHSKIIGVKQYDAIVDGSINVESDSLTATYKLTNFSNLPYTLTSITPSTVNITTSYSWITPTINRTNNTFSVRVLANNTGVTREGSVVLSGTSTGGGTAYKTVNVIQGLNPPIEESPIWRDMIETFIPEYEGEDYTSYRVADGEGNIIYNGRAYFNPDGEVKIKFNSIFENYINETIDLNSTGLQSNNGYSMFAVQRWNNDFNDWLDIKEYMVYNDWSYSPDRMPSGIISQSHILSTTLDSRQLFIQSYFNSINDGITTVHIYGNRSTSTRPLFSDFDVNEEIASYVLPASWVNNIWVHLNDDEAGTIEYDVELTCKPYALYWLNKYGGYDSMLLNKTTKQTDRLTNYDYTREIDNNTDEFEKIQYLKEIKQTWSIKTDILNDRQSEIVAEIAHSPQVYLHILDEDKIVPVNVTDSSVEHKQWRNNQRKRIVYTFTVENSQLHKRQ